jgi:CyaY protein
MSLTEARFHDLVDATQQAVEDIFDDSDLDLDLENSAGCSPFVLRTAPS